MDISGDNNHVSYDKAIDYFTKQFPLDLAQMMAARDELAQRQGAISAVQDANRLRAEADVYAASSKATSDDVLATAKADADEAKAKKAESNDLLKSLTSQRAELDAYVKTKEKEGRPTFFLCNSANYLRFLLFSIVSIFFFPIIATTSRLLEAI